jgi:hypothetical protein
MLTIFRYAYLASGSLADGHGTQMGRLRVMNLFAMV